MGLRIVYGKAGVGKSNFIFEEISNKIKNNELTTANELFTPDKYIEQFNAFLNKCK